MGWVTHRGNEGGEDGVCYLDMKILYLRRYICITSLFLRARFSFR